MVLLKTALCYFPHHFLLIIWCLRKAFTKINGDFFWDWYDTSLKVIASEEISLPWTLITFQKCIAELSLRNEYFQWFWSKFTAHKLFVKLLSTFCRYVTTKFYKIIILPTYVSSYLEIGCYLYLFWTLWYTTIRVQFPPSISNSVWAKNRYEIARLKRCLMQKMHNKIKVWILRPKIHNSTF